MKQKIKQARIFSFALTLILLFAVNVLTQTFFSTIVGKVTDVNGASVPNANVTITQKDTNRTQTVTTNSEGEYTITQLQPGEYTLKIEYTGFKISINENITLQTDTTSRVNVTLETGDVNETVTINSEPSVVNSETPEKGEVIVQRQVQELPLNVRDYTELAKLVPGIYQRPSDDDQGQGVASAGTRTDASNFILDGVANRNDRNGGVGVNTSVDSIQEFKVSTSTYSAEYGRLAGAQINVVSKSGTNRFSGTVFEYIRNNAFDANNALTPPDEKKILRRHQFGGTLGGPLPFLNFGEGVPFFDSGKDKRFFFVSFEQLREVRSQAASTVAPNAAWAQGDFRNVRGAGNDGIFGNADDTNRIMCLQRNASNPLRPTRVECPTPNVIPLGPVASNPNLLYASPTSLAILGYLPRANDPNSLDGYTYQTLSNILPRNLFSIKGDQKINDKNSFYLRYSIDNRDAYQPQAGRFNYPGFLRNWEYRQSSFAFGDTHNFTPSIINEFRFGVLNQDNKTLNENNDQDYLGLFGIPGLPTGQTPELQGFPAIRIDGYPDTGDSANVPFNYLYKNISFSDSLTWIFGNHNMKFGVDVIRPNYIENDIRNVRGDFRFRGRFTNPANATANGFRSFADFLYGIPDSTQRQLGAEPADLVAWQSAFYIQDSWRVASWLTLSLGVRYDYTPFLYEKQNRISNFIPQLGVSACADGEHRDPTTNALICVSAASLGLPRALVETDTNNLAPRFGFALKPFRDDKTVLRGGAGIFYSTETVNPARQQLALNYPFINRQSFNRASTADILQLTFANPFPDNRVSLQGVTTPLGIPTDSQTPEVYQFNLTLERELTEDLGFEIGYVGSQGRHLGMRYDLNYAYPTGALNTTVTPPTPVTAVAYPQFGSITYQVQAVNSSYNALQAVIRRRAKNGLTLLASYTFGKAMDQNSNTNNSTTGSQRSPQDIRNFQREWALADYHRTHQFSASFNYELPFGRKQRYFSNARGWTEVLFGGWQLNGIITLLSGRPFTPVYSSLDTASGRPDLLSDPMQAGPVAANADPRCQRTISQGGIAADEVRTSQTWFNPCAFGRPVATTGDPTLFGNTGRNIVIGPNFQSVDMSLFKNIRLGERTKLQLRWEAFNVLNHPNFQIPQHLLETSDTGQLRQTSNEAREMQFAIKFIF